MQFALPEILYFIAQQIPHSKQLYEILIAIVPYSFPLHHLLSSSV